MNYFMKLFLSGLLLLSGCNESQSVQAGKLNYGKPHAPVEMTFIQSVKPKVGVTIRYEILLTPGVDANDMQVSVSADEGLSLLEYPQQLQLGVQKKDQQQAVVVTCQPQREGLFYINISATVITDGKRQSRSFAIPVNVGDVDAAKHLKASGVVVEDAAGERIISMPAQQTLKTAPSN